MSHLDTLRHLISPHNPAGLTDDQGCAVRWAVEEIDRMRRGIEHIAKGNVSPAMKFAEELLNDRT